MLLLLLCPLSCGRRGRRREGRRPGRAREELALVLQIWILERSVKEQTKGKNQTNMEPGTLAQEGTAGMSASTPIAGPRCANEEEAGGPEKVAFGAGQGKRRDLNSDTQSDVVIVSKIDARHDEQRPKKRMVRKKKRYKLGRAMVQDMQELA